MKRRAGFSRGSQGRAARKWGRTGGWSGAGGRMGYAARRGRFAGYYRKTGYYGRYGQGSSEMKFHDIDVDDAVVSATGDIQNAGTINIIPQDVTEKTRVGRKCTIRSIGWRYKMALPEVNGAATPTAGDICRVILYLDKQANGLTATVTGILETANYQSFNNLANKSRFRILHDKQHTLNYDTLASHGFAADTFDMAQKHVNAKFFKKCNIPLEFDDSANTGVLTTIRSNNLGVLLISATGVCGFDSKFRLRFSDS